MAIGPVAKGEVDNVKSTHNTLALWLGACALAAWSVSAYGQEANGTVLGKVLDETNAMTLPGTPVEVVETKQLAYTDLDGKYTLDLPPGDYSLKVSFPGYHDRTVTGIHVQSGQLTDADIVLTVDALEFSEEVMVTAKIEDVTSTEAAQLLERKKATSISDNVGVQEMRANADSNAAAAMQRVVGLSVVDDQYVYVRGLGERYSNTTLNGAVLPTTQPDKRVVPLDLFPAALIDNVQVIKSYLPDKPADFAGGLVQIEPTNFPEKLTFNAALDLGGNSQTTFQDGLTYPGGSTDWLSFGAGSRALPPAIPPDKVAPQSIFGGGYPQEEMAVMARSFANVWEPRNGRLPADSKLSAIVGNSWEKLGAVFSVTWRKEDRSHQEQQIFYGVGAGEMQERANYDFDIATQKATLAMVGNLSYKLNGNNRLAFENFFSNNSTNETRYFEGFNVDINTDLQNTRLYWSEERILSSKLSGEHFFSLLSGSRVDWQVAYSNAKRDEPDLRETLYEYRRSRDQFVLADESQSGYRMFTNLNDDVWQGDVHWTTIFRQWGGLPASFKLGPSIVYRQRDFTTRRFRFNPRNTSLVDLSLPPESLFVPENLDGRAFELAENTRATDAYDADQIILAGYAMVDLPLSGALRLVGGARVERSEQNVNTFDLFDPTAAPIQSSLDNTDVLPGMNLVYSWGDMNLRAAYSHTVNRPEFRELAPFEFTDVVGGRAVAGNPALRRALIKNVDLRWEWFPGPTEVVAVSLFLKDFTDPIERVVEPTAQLRTSYRNALGASNKGVELEVRKELGAHFFVGLNYSLVDSSIELASAAGEVQTSLERPLEGQSKHLLNTVFEVRTAKRDLSGRVLFNYFGDRISDVGALGLPDILEEGRPQLDLVVAKRFGEHLAARFAVDNLLNSERRFTQGGNLQRLYKDGVSYRLSLGYTY
jgi:hypothetical protein